jgi:error-prone DNA polymerase
MTDTIDPSGYIELHCHSCFSLLDGAASPEGLVDRARELGQRTLALTDHADLGGAVRFSGAGRARGVETIIGAELDIMVNSERSTVNGTVHPNPFTVHRSPFTSLVLLAQSRTGYANISTSSLRPYGLPARRARCSARPARAPRRWRHRTHRRPARVVPSSWPEIQRTRRAASTSGTYGDRLVVECWDHGLPEEREP